MRFLGYLALFFVAALFLAPLLVIAVAMGPVLITALFVVGAGALVFLLLNALTGAAAGGTLLFMRMGARWPLRRRKSFVPEAWTSMIPLSDPSLNPLPQPAPVAVDLHTVHHRAPLARPTSPQRTRPPSAPATRRRRGHL